MLHGVQQLLLAKDVHVQVVCALIEVAVQHLHQILHALALAVTQCLGVDGLGVGDAVQCPVVGQLGHRVQGGQQAVLLRAVAGVCTRSKRSEGGAAVGQGTGVLAIYHVGGDGQDGGGGLGVAVGVALLDHLQEGLEQPHADLVGAVIVVAVLGEVTLGLKAGGKAVFIAHHLHLGVFDGAQGVDDVGEACNAGGKGAAHIGVDECHLGFLVVVLVVHILDEVQHVDV